MISDARRWVSRSVTSIGAAPVAGVASKQIPALYSTLVATLLRPAGRGAVNESATITIGEQTRIIADWLVWRREVAPKQSLYFASLRTKIEQARQEATRKGAGLSTSAETARPNDIVVNINEQDLARQIEALEEAQGRLDGQLSLKNATLMIDI